MLVFALERSGNFSRRQLHQGEGKCSREVEHPMTRTLCTEDSNVDERNPSIKRLTEHTESVWGIASDPSTSPVTPSPHLPHDGGTRKVVGICKQP